MTEEKENKREHIYPWEGVRDLSKNREGTLFFAMGLTMLVKLLVVEILKPNSSNLLGTSTSLVTTMPEALLEPQKCKVLHPSHNACAPCYRAGWG